MRRCLPLMEQKGGGVIPGRGPVRILPGLLAVLLCLSLGLTPAAGAEVKPGDGAYTAAVALVDQKKWAEAAAALQKFVADFPKHPEASRARVRLGDALLGQQKPDAAHK